MSTDRFPAYLRLLRPSGDEADSAHASMLGLIRSPRGWERDGLCGVGTRQALIERLETLAALSPNAPLSFALVKVHGLAETNRVDGFQAGDAVLRGVAAKVFELTRATDFVGRFTSSSFGVVLQGSGATAAAAVAGRLEHHLRTTGPSRTSIDVSVATGRGINATMLPLAAVDSFTGAG